MPELPEVETIKRDLQKSIIGEIILEVEVSDAMVVRSSLPQGFRESLLDKKIIDVQRRGKAIILKLEQGGFLVVQPMMTGQLIYAGKLPQARVHFKLSNGQYLNYNDQRRFGRLTFISDLGEMPFFKSIGIEPLEKKFTFEWLKNKMKARKTPIKTLLMDQHFIAGIGNIYASEILFRSKINPKKGAYRLKLEEIKLLHKETITVLKEAIKFRGSSVNNYRDAKGEKGRFVNRILVYRRENEKCSMCQSPIRKIVQAGRSTFFCKRCQS